MSLQTTSELYQKLQLSGLGIQSVDTIHYQLGYDELFQHEVSSSNEGFAKGVETSFGAVSVDTGQFTGRSAKDKYIVKNTDSENNVWWELKDPPVNRYQNQVGLN